MKHIVNLRHDDGNMLVAFYYSKASVGSRGRFGEPLEPDFPEEFEIESVVVNGVEIEKYNKWEIINLIKDQANG